MGEYVYKVVPSVAGVTTYDERQQLKNCGCKFNHVLGWYAADKIILPKNFAFITLDKDKIYDKANALIDGAAEYIDLEVLSQNPIKDTTDFYGVLKQRYRGLNCTLISKSLLNTQWGLKYKYVFKYENYIFEWLTETCYNITPNSHFKVDGTIVQHRFDNVCRINRMNKCKFTEIELAEAVEDNSGFDLR